MDSNLLKMTYKKTIEYLFSQLPMFQRVGSVAFKNTLSTSLALDKHLQKPHTKYKTIHIAGTNGKGSVAHSLASILQEAGKKVGLYTSPHYKDFRERIKVNGKLVSETYVIDFVQNNKDIFKKLKPSFFEMTSAMALDYFAEQKIDIAVIEVGLGGRLDSTNIISPTLSVITNISFDHQQFLGNTLEEIATEKAGIIKKDTPIIYGGNNIKVEKVIKNIAEKNNSPFFVANNNYSVKKSDKIVLNKQVIDVFKNNKIFISNLQFDLLGEYQLKNIPTIFQSFEILEKLSDSFKLSDNYRKIRIGLEKIKENTGIVGRWQILQKKPLIICDSAHNEAGIKAVTEQIQTMDYDTLHIIFGVVADKSLDKILKLLPKKAKYYFTKAKIPRALKPEKLQEAAKNFNLKGKIYPNVIKALEAAKQNAKNTDLIYIGGSIFVVAEVL